MSVSKLNDRELDRLCWLIVGTRNRFYPPDETAEVCIKNDEDDAEDNDMFEVTERSRGEEYGYHRGIFTSRNMLMEQLYGYGINVLGRANRYTKANRDYGMEFRLEEEPEYYLAVEEGAEMQIYRGYLEDVEIESLERYEYVPNGAESDRTDDS